MGGRSYLPHFDLPVIGKSGVQLEPFAFAGIIIGDKTYAAACQVGIQFKFAGYGLLHDARIVKVELNLVHVIDCRYLHRAQHRSHFRVRDFLNIGKMLIGEDTHARSGKEENYSGDEHHDDEHRHYHASCEPRGKRMDSLFHFFILRA